MSGNRLLNLDYDSTTDIDQVLAAGSQGLRNTNNEHVNTQCLWHEHHRDRNI